MTRIVGLLLLGLALVAPPLAAQPPKLSPPFVVAARTYYDQIRTLETSAALEMSQDDGRAYQRAREGATTAQATDGDRNVMSLLRQYSILVTRWRAMVVEARKTDFKLPPERAQQHATCRHEIDRSLTLGELFQNPKCSAAAR